MLSNKFSKLSQMCFFKLHNDFIDKNIVVLQALNSVISFVFDTDVLIFSVT